MSINTIKSHYIYLGTVFVVVFSAAKEFSKRNILQSEGCDQY